MRTLLKAGIRVPAYVPTIGLHVQVSSPMTVTNNWHWMPLDGCAPHAVEVVHTRHELERVLLSYGPWVATMLVRASSSPRFRIMARGLFTGRLLGQYAWAWNPLHGQYEAEPEPWIVWSKSSSINPSAPTFPGYTLSGLSRYVRAVLGEQTQGLPRLGIDLRSAVRPLDAIPEQIPHVRDKEDVPHEDALPDLYGLPSGEAA
jgi:hypothetical protein